MKEANFLAVLALIHEAALRPAGWDDVLRRLAALTGCVAGGLTVERPATRRGTPLTYFGFDPDHVARTFDHYLPMNPLFRIEPSMQPGFVVANADVVAPEVFRRSEFYRGWARPQGLCSPVTVVIHRTPASYVSLTLVRPDGAGEVTAGGRTLLSRLAPHLVHAMDVSHRLRAAGEAQRQATVALDALSCAAVVVDRERRVVFTNDAARQLLDEAGGVLSCKAAGIAIRDPATDRRFQAAMSLALGHGGAAKGGHLLVPRPPGEGNLTVSLSPLPPADGPWNALDGEAAGQARCLLLISGRDVTGMAEHYRLTPAETRMLSAIVVGRGLAAAARELGIARSTAQSHLDKIFQKTGTHRQAQLVGLARAGIG